MEGEWYWTRLKTSVSVQDREQFQFPIYYSFISALLQFFISFISLTSDLLTSIKCHTYLHPIIFNTRSVILIHFSITTKNVILIYFFLSTRNVILNILSNNNNNNNNNFTSLRTASFAPLAVKNFNPVQSYSLQKFNNKIEKSKKLLEFSGTLSFIKQTLKRHNFGLDWNFSTLFVSKQLVFQRWTKLHE